MIGLTSQFFAGQESHTELALLTEEALPTFTCRERSSEKRALQQTERSAGLLPACLPATGCLAATHVAHGTAAGGPQRSRPSAAQLA
eukprot:COSAG01_NODE_4771_length_4754_cov_4.582814_7_plen_87_part_00